MTLIHIASIKQNNYLFLRKVADGCFQWFIPNPSFTSEERTDIQGSTPTEACSAGHREWLAQHFRLINCGFRYTLPERDAVGSNALFWQMALSYNSFNGRYFDEEVGHQCYVDFASHEALEILRKLNSFKSQ